MGTDVGNWYKIWYLVGGFQQYAIARAATPQAAVTAAIADAVVGLTSANVIEVQNIDPQPVTINT